MDETFITLMGDYLVRPSLLPHSVLIRSSGGAAVARAMPLSTCTSAKRAFVAVLRALCATYSLACGANRDSTEDEVSATFRRVARRVHPDKGGDKAAAQQLNAARDACLAARAGKGQAGRPQGAQAPQPPGPRPPAQQVAATTTRERQSASGTLQRAAGAQPRSDYTVNAEAVLLTYQRFAGLDQWRRFVSFVSASLARWQVKHWSATLETNADGTPHAHLMLQFRRTVDRTTRSFTFEGGWAGGRERRQGREGWWRQVNE